MRVEEIKEREVFYIKSQAVEYGFLRQGTSKVSSTIAPTLEIVSNTYMEGIPRQRQSLPRKRDLWLYIVRVHRRELHTENSGSVQVIPFSFQQKVDNTGQYYREQSLSLKLSQV